MHASPLERDTYHAQGVHACWRRSSPLALRHSCCHVCIVRAKRAENAPRGTERRPDLWGRALACTQVVDRTTYRPAVGRHNKRSSTSLLLAALFLSAGSQPLQPVCTEPATWQAGSCCAMDHMHMHQACCYCVDLSLIWDCAPIAWLAGPVLHADVSTLCWTTGAGGHSWAEALCNSSAGRTSATTAARIAARAIIL